MTEDEVVGWHHRLDGHEFEQAPGVGNGQESLACCSPCGHKESRLSDWTELDIPVYLCTTSSSAIRLSGGVSVAPVVWLLEAALQ